MRVVNTINQMLIANPAFMQFTKDTEWLSDLLAYLPRFEDNGVLGMSVSAPLLSHIQSFAFANDPKFFSTSLKAVNFLEFENFVRFSIFNTI